MLESDFVGFVSSHGINIKSSEYRREHNKLFLYPDILSTSIKSGFVFLFFSPYYTNHARFVLRWEFQERFFVPQLILSASRCYESYPISPMSCNWLYSHCKFIDMYISCIFINKEKSFSPFFPPPPGSIRILLSLIYRVGGVR